jgi:TonB family protein
LGEVDSPTNTLRNIGPYLVYEELGRGAGGVVYRALDPRIGRDLAIKELTISRLGPDEIEEARQRFVREARAVGNLRHDNVVMLYQFLEEKDSLYLVMEFVAGGSLHAFIKRGGPLSVEAALGIIRQVAAALDHAHALGIVHRDIKPGNILISAAGAGVPLVKVADFGIARISSEQMTMPGISFGTPAYMAPEQINGSVVDAKADQFSLGVVAYELLARRRPFAGANDQGLVYQILNAEPAPVAEGNPELPGGVDRVLRRALSKNPAQRFESCGAFAAALEEVLLGAPEATRKSVAAVAAPRIPVVKKRSGRGALLGGLIAALLLAGGLGLYFNSRNGPSATPVTPTTTGAGLPTPGAGVPAAPLPVPDAVIPARLLRRVPPQYPAAARSLRIQGVVKLEATIGADGTVRNLRVVSGNPYLVDAAKRAVEDWKYQPAKLHGGSVDSETTVNVNFKLDD